MYLAIDLNVEEIVAIPCKQFHKTELNCEVTKLKSINKERSYCVIVRINLANLGKTR